MANFDLKPCPFCGGTAHIRAFGGKYRVSCSGCGATGGAVWVKQWHNTKFIAQGQAAKLWNERAVNGAGMATLQDRDAVLEALWKQLDDVPMNPETEELEAAFLHFPAGTNRLRSGTGSMIVTAKVFRSCCTAFRLTAAGAKSSGTSRSRTTWRMFSRTLTSSPMMKSGRSTGWSAKPFANWSKLLRPRCGSSLTTMIRGRSSGIRPSKKLPKNT